MNWATFEIREQRVKGKRKKRTSTARHISTKAAVVLLLILSVWGVAAEWFVHHPRAWVNQQPSWLAAPLLFFGNPLADLTDSLGWTGHDVVYEYDTEAPVGQVDFAGLPHRVGAPAPDDITVLNRGEFKIGWSPSLRHPVWCAYHVPADKRFEPNKRPAFKADRQLAKSPHPDDYTHSGYDRGHMVPNYAIDTRYGDISQGLTFLMSNIAPQTPALNRGVWREVEHRIADFWTARYGEIWVVVGCIPSASEKIGTTGIDVPTHFYQVVLAQKGMDVRALAMLFPQNVSWREWAARHLITIDELEALTGLDFNPSLPSFIQEPLESELPSRLWPIRLWDIIPQIMLRLSY